MKWLRSLFDKKDEDVIISSEGNTSGKNEVYHANIDNHIDIKKDGVKETMGKNPLLDLKELELRDLSKHQIDALEQWCRRLIDDIFKKNYGNSYIDAEVQPGQPLIKARYLFRTPLVKNDIRVSVQSFTDSCERIDSMLSG